MTYSAQALKCRPQFANLPVPTIQTAVDGAMADFLDYTGRETVPDRALNLVTDMAAVRLVRMGAEGSLSVSEDGMSRSWEAIPSDLRERLDRYRRPLWP